MSANGVPWEVAPAVQKVGLGYRAEFPGDVRLAVSRLRESRGELHGELSAEHQGSHLYRGSMNLSGMTSRKSAAQYLQSQTNGASLPWPSILEHFCVGVLDQQRAGSPVVIGGGPNIGPRVSRPRLVPILHDKLPTILYAPGGTGKTTLAAGIGVSVSCGLPLMHGWMPLRRTKVLVLDYESDLEAWNDLFGGIAEGMGVTTPAYLYLPCDRPVADQVETLSEIISDHGIGLVIVDAMMMALGGGRSDGDPAETALRLFGALSQFHGVTKLLLDHVAGADLGSDRESTKPYGSIVKLNQARGAYELRAAEAAEDGSYEAMLIHRKVNYGRKDPRRGFRVSHEDGGVIRFTECQIEAAELVGRMPTVERMRRALLGGGLSVADLATELDVPSGTIRTALSRDHGERFLKLADGRIGLQL